MAASYQRINYSLRPAKAIERKMLCHAFRRLSHLNKIESYRYIGFGSTYFSDFSLIHKSLGIVDLISIEKDSQNAARFEFNRPFNCISLLFGHSNQVLPTLAWDVPTILWLDYDGQLDSTVLEDIATFCKFAIPNSMLVVTVNANQDTLDYSQLKQPYDSLQAIHSYRVEKFIERVGKEKVPADLTLTGRDLNQPKKAGICHLIMTDEIIQSLDRRNKKDSLGHKIRYQQLFNFHYKNGAKMLTLGGLIYDEALSDEVSKCAFEDLDFVRTGEDPYVLEVPNLTFREIHYLSAQLPFDGNEIPNLPGIPKADIEKFARIYRYFPTFAQAEF